MKHSIALKIFALTEFDEVRFVYEFENVVLDGRESTSVRILLQKKANEASVKTLKRCFFFNPSP